MRFELGRACFVDVEDGYNYTLKIRHTVTGDGPREAKAENVGKVVERTIGYHNSLESAVTSAIRQDLCSESEAKEARAIIVGMKKTVDAAREVTRDLRANIEDLRSLDGLLAKPSTTNIEKARALVRRALG